MESTKKDFTTILITGLIIRSSTHDQNPKKEQKELNILLLRTNKQRIIKLKRIASDVYTFDRIKSIRPAYGNNKTIKSFLVCRSSVLFFFFFLYFGSHSQQ